MICKKCGENNDEGSKFCQNCGAVISNEGPSRKKAMYETRSKEEEVERGLLGVVEKKIYFKIARGFAWLFLFIATIGLVGSIVYLFQILPGVLGKANTAVKAEEVRIAIAEKQRDTGTYKTYPTKGVDLELLKELDSNITDILYLYPEEERNKRSEQNMEDFKRSIKSRLYYWDSMEDRINVLKDIKKELSGFSNNPIEITEAIFKFIELKQEKENFNKEIKQRTLTEIGITSGAIIAMIIIITLGSMILVLLAVERNTRRIS